MKKNTLMALWALGLTVWSGSGYGQASQLFDGDFESGTFQGWTPGGENGGFASIAARGGCYSGNDTTAISFNGNDTSNYAALLRSNAAGKPDSIALLRSQSFTAGNGVIFSALSETLDADPGHEPVELLIRIIDSSGSIVAELPYRTAIIQLSQGCPSEARDAAFSSHFIDTHHLAGQEISIEFAQHTRHDGLGYFTLIDNVLFLDQGQFVLNSGQPIAVAGTGVTQSGTFFLDPRASVDPDNGPVELTYRWFVDGEDSIREIDIPCVNLNSDFQITGGNNKATLYVSDGFHYSADTIRFVIPDSSSDGNDSGTDTGSDTSTDTGDTTTDTNDDQQADTNTDGGNANSNITLSDPLEECNVDVREVVADTTGGTTNGGTNDNNTAPVISVDGGSGTDPVVDFTIDGGSVFIVDSVTLSDADGDSIVSVTVSITNARDGDTLTLDSTDGLTITGSGSTSIVISQADSDNPADFSEFESAVESIEFDYQVPAGETEDTTNRSISYVANDGTDSSEPATSEVDVSI